MKLSLNWLKQYVDYSLSPEELSSRLTMAGLEVEHVEAVGQDTVFEIEVTPNRPDCLSVLGLAREVSAILDKELKIPTVSDYDDCGAIDIEIESAADCGRYIGTRIDGVALNSFSEDKSAWLQALGSKPISNVVDITNFVLFEFGQPLHAFDFDKLQGGKIVVRRARKGEKIVTLDDIERTLDEGILVIADAARPVAIAGIMGGRDAGVTASTKRILLESASFDPGVIRRASRKLGLTSDSCYRFERGTAWRTVETASNRATDLVLESAGGSITARRDAVVQVPVFKQVEVVVSIHDIQKLLGAPLDLARAGKILKRLGCIVAASEQRIAVIPPHFRHDIHIKEDVIEEVARIVGYDNLPMSLPQISASNIVINQDKETFNRRLTDVCVGLGCNQVVTYALVGSAALAKTNYQGPVIKLQNAMSAEQEMMRPTALSNMLTVAAANMNRGQRDLMLFEVGKKYLPGTERWTLSMLMSGRRAADWRIRRVAQDFFDLKGVLEAVFARLRVSACSFSLLEDAAFENGQAAQVLIRGQVAGNIGKVAEDVLLRFDIKKTAVYFAEIDIEMASDAVEPRQKFIAIEEFPAMVRDISLAVKGASFEVIKRLCLDNGKGLLRKVDFIELYCGDKVEPEYKGYVLSLTYQSGERTLTDIEVNGLHEGIAVKLADVPGIKRR